jgi:hypothetical protein
MSNTPADVANQALDAAGFDFTIGDLQEGTKPAQVLLRAYSQCLRQLLRSVHWNFARKRAPMTLLADASGNTPNVPTNVISPWMYEYAYPTDCMKARFVPWSRSGVYSPPPYGNILPRVLSPQAPTTPSPSGQLTNFNSDFGPPPLPATQQPFTTPLTGPIMGGLGAPNAGAFDRPSRFLEAMDPNYPAESGLVTWEVQGMSPQGRSVILSNVQSASLVYTALMNYPSNWDAQFRAAFVAYLASEVAFALWSQKGNPKLGMQVRDTQVKIAASKIMAARVTDGNEGWHNSDFIPDWMKFRNVGGGFRGGYSQGFGSLDDGGIGIYYAGLDGCCGVANSSAY